MGYDYVEIGRRIRETRESMRYTVEKYPDGQYKRTHIHPRGTFEGKKLSIDKMFSYMKENGLYTCRKGTYIQLEYGEEKAFKNIKLEQLLSLCTVFDCDMEYLFGDLDYYKHDYKFINEKTGITQPASQKLIRLHDYGINDLTDHGKILSEFILHSDFSKLMNYIMMLKNARNPETEQIEKQKTYANLSGIEETESAVSQSFKDRADVAWMRATNIFQNIINDISD